MAYMRDKKGRRLDAFEVSSRRAEAYVDFSQRADGVPTADDYGLPLGIWNNGLNVSGYTISGGYLVHGNPTAANAASYLEVQLASTVKRIGCRAKFNTGNPGAKVALVNWATPGIIASEAASTGIPKGPIHLTADHLGWNIQVFQGTGNGPILAQETYTTTMPTDSDGCHTYQVIRDYDTLYVIRPDGTVTPGVQNSQIATYASAFASWELYEYASTLTPAQLREIWASS